MQRARAVRGAHRAAAAGAVEGVPVPGAGRRERGAGRAPRRRALPRHRRAVRRVPAPARRGPRRHGARGQRRDARQLPHTGRVHALPGLPRRRQAAVRVAAGRGRGPRAPRLRLRRARVPGPRRRVRVGQAPAAAAPGRPSRVVTYVLFASFSSRYALFVAAADGRGRRSLSRLLSGRLSGRFSGRRNCTDDAFLPRSQNASVSATCTRDFY